MPDAIGRAGGVVSALPIRPPQLTPRDTLAEISDRGTLRVAVQWLSPPESGEPPEFYIDPKTGRPDGIAIKIADMMARDLDVEAHYVDIPWKDQIDALLRREVDLLPKHSNTPGRAVLVDFGGRLMPFDIIVLVRADSDIHRPEDLNRDGIVIATWEGSSCRQVIERHFPRAAIVESQRSREQLRNGTAHAVVTDAVTKISMELYPEQRALRDAAGKVLVLAREYGHPAVYPGDHRFLNWINNWISYWRAQGVLDYWCETWWNAWFVQ
jgi:ABC-type amino acid transport substrate-binding protein